MEAELTTLDTAGVEAEWLYELLMNLSVVEKPILEIYMNCDNQGEQDNMKSTMHVKRWLKSIRKLRNSRVIALDYVHTSKKIWQITSLRDYHVM
jgi:DNA-binding protein Fis